MAKGRPQKNFEEAIKMLHDAGLVFGDLRAPNIMFSGDDVFIIDFDWAGKVGEMRYPRHLSSVMWPEEAGKLELTPILKSHDLLTFMLDQLFPELSGGRSHPLGIDSVSETARPTLQLELDKSETD